MDGMTEVVIGGKTYWLNYSMAVMFGVTDKYGDVQTALDAINGDGKESFEAVRWMLAAMAEDGELVRRELGYDKQEMLKESDISVHMRPYEYAELAKKTAEAIQRGYYREIVPSEDDEVDIGLAELNQKKTKTKRR